MILRSMSIVYSSLPGRYATTVPPKMIFVELDSIVRRRRERPDVTTWEYCRMHVTLETGAASTSGSSRRCTSEIDLDATSLTRGSPMPDGRSSPAVPAFLSVLPFLATTFHGTVGYFSSGWPVAYLVATVIFGIGLLIGSVMPVFQPAADCRAIVVCPAGSVARAEDGVRRPNHRHGRLPVGRSDATTATNEAVSLGPQVRPGLRPDGNHLRHRGEGYLAGAGDV